MRGLQLAVLLLCLCAPVLGGCGGVYYTVSANSASTRLEQARLMGAEAKAPYEYYFAREHLRQAQVEAAEASYSDAASYAETAELYAQKAIDVMQAAKREDTSSSSGPTGRSIPPPVAPPAPSAKPAGAK
jgi:hypothetical protein